jgi:BolA protein
MSLDVVDESHLHAGHAGARAGGETHYRVTIASARFSGRGRVERHRMIYALLADEIAAGVHALALHTKAPEES